MQAAEIRTWLIRQLAEELEIDAAEIEGDVPIDRYGVDSLMVQGIAGELESWLGRALSADLLWDYPTIDGLSQHLAEAAETRPAG